MRGKRASSRSIFIGCQEYSPWIYGEYMGNKRNKGGKIFCWIKHILHVCLLKAWASARTSWLQSTFTIKKRTEPRIKSQDSVGHVCRWSHDSDCTVHVESNPLRVTISFKLTRVSSSSHLSVIVTCLAPTRACPQVKEGKPTPYTRHACITIKTKEH